MKSVLFGIFVFISLKMGWAQVAPPGYNQPPQYYDQFGNLLTRTQTAVSNAGTVSCDCGENGGGQVYTPAQAFEDLQKEPLQFVGRDYPESAAVNQNLNCVHKNRYVYVILDGCRPSPTQNLSVFSAYIINRNGGMVHIYIENNHGTYTLADARPGADSLWKIESVATPPLQGELDVRGALNAFTGITHNYNNPVCLNSTSATTQSTQCYKGACDSTGNLSQVFNDSMAAGLQRVHDTIKLASRKPPTH